MTVILPPAIQDNESISCVTNRARSTTHYGVLDSLEVPLIDTLRLSGPIHDHHVAHWQIKRTVDSNGEFEDHFTSTRVSTDDFDIHVWVARDGQMEAVIERSLPTLRFGHNIDAVGVLTATYLVSDLYRRASHFVDWAVDVGELRVRRLDLDRDFDAVTHLDHLLGGLRRVNVPRTRNASVYSDNEHNGGALTLTRSVKGRWRASLYDKHEQVCHLARHQRDPARSARLQNLAAGIQGRVRYEAQLRGPALLAHGLRNMSDLTEPRLLNLREYYFHRAQFDTPVGGVPRVIAVMKRLQNSSDPEYRFFGAVHGMLMAEALNFAQPMPSPTTLAKYRKLAKKWGLTAADVYLKDGPPVALDFERGTLMAAW